ncbi:MAG: hypothetical protein HZB55_07295 [Deltaproteobacteria bacterium]|nr:hypothetical protein [Deltaproteobacteria bacterium]
MKVKPVLGDWEIPNIAYIGSLERRDFAEMPVPGKVGSVFQDLSSAPTRVVIAGSLFGDDKRDEVLEAVRTKFRAGEPVTFVADIVTATEVQYVVIEELRFEESAEVPDQTAYQIVVRESPPPPPPPNPLAGLDAGLLDQAGSFLDSVAGALAAIDGLGSIPDFGNPVPPLTSSLDQVEGAASGLTSAVQTLRGLFGIGE